MVRDTQDSDTSSLLGVPVRVEGKKRIADENCASSGKLNKGFVRKRCFQRLIV